MVNQINAIWTVREPLFQFKKMKQTHNTLYYSWESIIMHLPYAFQGRRMLTEIYALTLLP
jgi:hydroxymethylglutaryl-CoA synthase